MLNVDVDVDVGVGGVLDVVALMSLISVHRKAAAQVVHVCMHAHRLFRAHTYKFECKFTQTHAYVCAGCGYGSYGTCAPAAAALDA